MSLFHVEQSRFQTPQVLPPPFHAGDQRDAMRSAQTGDRSPSVGPAYLPLQQAVWAGSNGRTQEMEGGWRGTAVLEERCPEVLAAAVDVLTD